MRNHRICTLLLPLFLVAASITSTVVTSHADSGGRGDRAVARSVGRSGGSVTYGGRGSYGSRGSYTRYVGPRHDSHFSGSVWIGPGWGYYDPFFYPYYYNYPAYPYYYSPPTVVAPQEPQEYISPDTQQEQEGGQYWYYCRKPQGYYPYVERCPGGWLKVVPDTTPPSQEQEDKEE
ncbi:hypothetical protein [Geomonas edaphica]|uniref:hypothetical protein n=1 Tax=Geomonas edaphica TaxID=2570226 RepID=UPI0010A84C04|nr:hypothetical protein [Geomonas edaphica]